MSVEELKVRLDARKSGGVGSPEQELIRQRSLSSRSRRSTITGGGAGLVDLQNELEAAKKEIEALRAQGTVPLRVLDLGGSHTLYSIILKSSLWDAD